MGIPVKHYSNKKNDSVERTNTLFTTIWLPKTPAYKPHLFGQNFRVKLGMRLICEKNLHRLTLFSEDFTRWFLKELFLCELT